MEFSEVSVLREPRAVLRPRCNIKNIKPPELTFRAFLGDGTTEVRFERAIV
jgi:hypothetical protein